MGIDATASAGSANSVQHVHEAALTRDLSVAALKQTLENLGSDVERLAMIQDLAHAENQEDHLAKRSEIAPVIAGTIRDGHTALQALNVVFDSHQGDGSALPGQVLGELLARLPNDALRFPPLEAFKPAVAPSAENAYHLAAAFKSIDQGIKAAATLFSRQSPTGEPQPWVMSPQEGLALLRSWPNEADRLIALKALFSNIALTDQNFEPFVKAAFDNPKNQQRVFDLDAGKASVSIDAKDHVWFQSMNASLLQRARAFGGGFISGLNKQQLFLMPAVAVAATVGVWATGVNLAPVLAPVVDRAMDVMGATSDLAANATYIGVLWAGVAATSMAISGTALGLARAALGTIRLK